MKKLLSAVLTTTMVLASATTSFAKDANSYTPSPESDFYIDRNYILAYIGDGGVVVIPSEVDGQVITGIDNDAFNYGGGIITTLVLPDTIEFIGHFNSNIFLEEMIIGNPDLSLGLWSFDNSPWKTSKEFLTTDNGKLLAYNGDDTVVTVPDYVTSIGEYSIEGTSATTFILPSSVTTIHDCAFWNNDSLEAIYMPTSVTEIQPLPFFTTVTDATITIYYEGTEAQKNQMTIGDLDNGVKELIWVYNSTPPTPEVETPEVPETQAPTYSSWADVHVAFADENNLVVASLGDDYTVNITRAQIADLLVNMIEQYTGTTLSTEGSTEFSDTDSVTAQKANAAGIITGRDGNLFDGSANATRQEMAVMVHKAILKMEQTTNNILIDHSDVVYDFGDNQSIDNWATNAVYILANNNIMRGSDSGFEPKGNTTIEQSFVLNNNLFKLG